MCESHSFFKNKTPVDSAILRKQSPMNRTEALDAGAGTTNGMKQKVLEHRKMGIDP